MAENMADKALEIIEVANATGKIKKGANEATKAIEKGTAKFVVVAEDVSPAEVVMHIPLIAKEKDIPAIKAGTKEALGAAAGLEVGTAAVAVLEEGEAKPLIKDFANELGSGNKAEVPAKKEAPAEEPKAEEKTEETPAEEAAPAKEKKEE